MRSPESEVAIPNAAEGGRAVIRSFPKSEFTKPSTAVEELTISSSKPKSKRFKKQGLSKQVIGIDALTAKSGSGKDDKDAAQKAGLEQKGKRGKPDVQEGNRNPDRSESKARANSSRKRPRSDDTPGDPRVEPDIKRMKVLKEPEPISGLNSKSSAKAILRKSSTSTARQSSRAPGKNHNVL